MRLSIYALLVGSLLGLSPHLRAQPGAPRAATAAYNPLAPDGGLLCAQGHTKTSLRTATSSVAHRAKMDRYDVKYYKLDLAMESNSLNVAGSVWMRIRVGSQALDSLAFELYQAPAGSSAGTATL